MTVVKLVVFMVCSQVFTWEFSTDIIPTIHDHYRDVLSDDDSTYHIFESTSRQRCLPSWWAHTFSISRTLTSTCLTHRPPYPWGRQTPSSKYVIIIKRCYNIRVPHCPDVNIITCIPWTVDPDVALPTFINSLWCRWGVCETADWSAKQPGGNIMCLQCYTVYVRYINDSTCMWTLPRKYNRAHMCSRQLMSKNKLTRMKSPPNPKHFGFCDSTNPLLLSWRIWVMTTLLSVSVISRTITCTIHSDVMLVIVRDHIYFCFCDVLSHHMILYDKFSRFIVRYEHCMWTPNNYSSEYVTVYHPIGFILEVLTKSTIVNIILFLFLGPYMNKLIIFPCIRIPPVFCIWYPPLSRTTVIVHHERVSGPTRI